MLVTLSGIVTLVRELQLSKAPKPMLVTLSGIVTLVRDLQPEKASSPMHVTVTPSIVCGILALVTDELQSVTVPVVLSNVR